MLIVVLNLINSSNLWNGYLRYEISTLEKKLKMSNYGKIKKDSIVSDFCTENKQAVRFDGKKFYES